MSPDVLLAGVVLVALLLYTLTGGADFGGGVWDLFAVGPRAVRQRKLIADAIGPIWEANHVWLILVIVALFVGFPHAFAAVSTALHVPLVLMLIGVVLRGSAFVFRTYAPEEDAARWGRVFAGASAYTPVMLGVSLGAVASGALVLGPDGRVITDFVSAWWAPFPFAIGGFTVALFALLAAVYLTVEAEDPALIEDFRLRALVAALATAGFAYLSLALSRAGAPPVWDALTARAWSLPFHVVTIALGTGLVAALWARRFRLSRTLVVALAAAVEVGWTAGQYPYVVPPDLTIHAAAAPPSVLVPVLWALALGTLLLVPSFAYLYTVFKGGRG